MRVTVRLFGAPRVALRFREREFALPEGTTVAGLVEEVVREVGPIAGEYLLGPGGRGYGVAFARNGRAALPDESLSEGDLVYMLPPTAGG